MTEDLCINIYR